MSHCGGPITEDMNIIVVYADTINIGCYYNAENGRFPCFTVSAGWRDTFGETDAVICTADAPIFRSLPNSQVSIVLRNASNAALPGDNRGRKTLQSCCGWRKPVWMSRCSRAKSEITGRGYDWIFFVSGEKRKKKKIWKRCDGVGDIISMELSAVRLLNSTYTHINMHEWRPGKRFWIGCTSWPE